MRRAAGAPSRYAALRTHRQTHRRRATQHLRSLSGGEGNKTFVHHFIGPRAIVHNLSARFEQTLFLFYT